MIIFYGIIVILLCLLVGVIGATLVLGIMLIVDMIIDVYRDIKK